MASGTNRHKRRALILAAMVTVSVAGAVAYNHRPQPSEMRRMSAAASTFPIPAGFRRAVDDDIECGHPRLCDQDHYVIRWIQTDPSADPCKAATQAAQRWRRDGFEPAHGAIGQTGVDCAFRGSIDGHYVDGYASRGKEPESTAAAPLAEPAVIVLNVVSGPASKWLPSKRCQPGTTTSTQLVPGKTVLVTPTC